MLAREDDNQLHGGLGDADSVMHETAMALRQAGRRAQAVVHQVQHVLQDTPEAASEVAGKKWGSCNMFGSS
jgi:hypothetical protein